MGELYLVRHGQANSGATSEEDYDRLSDLGHAQARLLGAWMRDHEAPFDHILSGTMRRHRETAAGMGVEPERFDARLNEMEYFALIRDMEVHHGVAPPASSEDFAVHMPQTLAAWEQATIDGSEPFASFESRILGAIAEASKPGKRGLSTDQMAHVLLPIYNSSLHRFRIRPEGTFLMTFNGIPHLDPPKLADHRTHL